MIFAITHQFKKNCIEARTEARSDHIAHVKGMGDRLKVAGPIPVSDTDNNPWGSLIVIEVHSFSAAQLFTQNDPYVKCGIVENTTIQTWTPAIGGWLD